MCETGTLLGNTRPNITMETGIAIGTDITLIFITTASLCSWMGSGGVFTHGITILITPTALTRMTPLITIQMIITTLVPMIIITTTHTRKMISQVIPSQASHLASTQS